MNSYLHTPKKIIRIFLVSSLLTVGPSELQIPSVKAQANWYFIDTPKAQSTPEIWETSISDSEKLGDPQEKWEVVPKPEDQNQSQSGVIWEVLENEDKELIPPSENQSNSRFIPPENLDEAEALLDTIPLQSSDFKPLLNVSHAVPTASVLSQEEWRLIASTISPFKYASGTGNQNYAIQLDYGLSDTLQISGFYSEADNPLNTQITGLNIRPDNLWEVFGAAVRWKFFTSTNVSLALNSSLESWTVGSGGNDSSDQNSSPNIFNDSKRRVETQNLVGSISFPLTWHSNKEWQFTFNPGISFLPPRQGEGQGGSGEFYGTNPYISGGLLWHPIPEIAVTASVAQPFGSGNNNFDRDIKYTKVPIFSGGINFHLNPRIALQGQLTNGFGLTPATALLTLPSDNRLGYSARFIYTPDAADTPQPSFSPKQQSLSLGGLTVNTALVPADTTSIAKISTDNKGGFDTTIGFSISNIFHLDFYSSKLKSVPQTNIQARTYFANSSTSVYRGSGKVVLTSPLRGAPIWSAVRLSFGQNIDEPTNTANGYLFAETPLTWEGNSKIAININPKLAWTGVGSLWGIGLGANLQLAPGWELVPEANLVLNSLENSNCTLGLRWNATDNVTIEVYGTTASSIIDIGQIINADEVRWGSRISIKL